MAVKIIKEGNDTLFDSKEYKAERMMDYIVDGIKDLQERYNTSMDLNGSIEDALFDEILRIYNTMD